MDWLGWQIDYLLLLQNFRDLSFHVFDKFFLMVTMFGEVYIPLGITCLIYWCISKRAGFYILSSYMYSFLLNTVCKFSACIYRPWVLDARVKPVAEAIPAATGYSFPSGHTAGAVAIFGSILVWLRENKLIKYTCLTLILLVMMSRNYLGVHTPQDVVVSLVFGVFIILYNKKLLIWCSKGKHRDILISGVVTVLSILVMLYIYYKHCPIDYLNGKILYDPLSAKIDMFTRIGFVIGSFWGWTAEKHFISFRPKNGSLIEKVIRFFIGIFIAGLILKYADLCLIKVFGNLCGLFIKYVITGLFITCIYPLFIKYAP